MMAFCLRNHGVDLLAPIVCCLGEWMVLGDSPIWRGGIALRLCSLPTIFYGRSIAVEHTFRAEKRKTNPCVVKSNEFGKITRRVLVAPSGAGRSQPQPRRQQPIYRRHPLSLLVLTILQNASLWFSC